MANIPEFKPPLESSDCSKRGIDNYLGLMDVDPLYNRLKMKLFKKGFSIESLLEIVVEELNKRDEQMERLLKYLHSTVGEENVGRQKWNQK